MTGAEISGKGGAMKNLSSPAFAAILLLASCGSAPQKPGTTAAKGPPSMFCPQVAVLQQAQTLTLFLPDRADVAARISTAQITGVSGSCKLEPKKHALVVTVNTAFMADNGPANNFNPLTLSWFAAITSGDTIIQKTDYIRVFNFDGNSSAVSGTAKPIKVELPNVPNSANTEILVGFMETPEQLAYAAAHPNAAP
jgi:hypothetical protein